MPPSLYPITKQSMIDPAIPKLHYFGALFFSMLLFTLSHDCQVNKILDCNWNDPILCFEQNWNLNQDNSMYEPTLVPHSAAFQVKRVPFRLKNTYLLKEYSTLQMTMASFPLCSSRTWTAAVTALSGIHNHNSRKLAPFDLNDEYIQMKRKVHGVPAQFNLINEYIWMNRKAHT